MMKFIDGSLRLSPDGEDREAFIKRHDAGMNKVIEWGNRNNVVVSIGITGAGAFVCEYKILKKTDLACKSMLSELKAVLKEQVLKPTLLSQINGNAIY